MARRAIGTEADIAGQLRFSVRRSPDGGSATGAPGGGCELSCWSTPTCLGDRPMTLDTGIPGAATGKPTKPRLPASRPAKAAGRRSTGCDADHDLVGHLSQRPIEGSDESERVLGGMSMSRIRHLCAAGCLLVSSLVVSAAAAGSASATIQGFAPLGSMPGPPVAGRPAMAGQTIPAAACVAVADVRSGITALPARFAPAPAVFTATKTVARGERPLLALEDFKARRSACVRMVAVLSRHVWSVPVCRSPPDA